MKAVTLLTASLVFSAAAVSFLPSPAVADDRSQKTSQEPSVKIASTVQNKASRPSCQQSIVVHAPVKAVWQAIQDQRLKDPDQVSTTPLKKEPGKILLEQKLCFASVFGDAECTVNALEIPLKRVDYWMTESEDFKSIEGSWVVEPVSADQTRLTLTSSMDLRMPLPKFVVNTLIQKRVERNLDMVRKIAEKEGN